MRLLSYVDVRICNYLQLAMFGGIVSRMETRGRPTKYNDSMPEKVYAYIKKCKDNPMGETREGQDIPRLPVLAELSSILKVNKDTIVEWRKKYDLFSDACAELVAMQETILIQCGAVLVPAWKIIQNMLIRFISTITIHCG